MRSARLWGNRYHAFPYLGEAVVGDQSEIGGRPGHGHAALGGGGGHARIDDLLDDPDDQNNERPGPEPERLKIEEDHWKEAVKKAVRKEKPPEGWPKKEGEEGED